MPDEEEAFALALREGVTNVVRHAGATRCGVRLRRDGSQHTLDIEDDGVGVSGMEGNGLRGMRERLRALRGSVALTSAMGVTRLRVRI